VFTSTKNYEALIDKFFYYIVMDRSWINKSRISDVYENGVEEFLQFAHVV